MYDFIIFEHTGLKNHMIDLCAIGRMLRDSGYSVAIANVTIEGECCKDSTLPIIDLQCRQYEIKSKNSYMRAAFKELIPKAHYFYIGSMLSNTWLSWVREVPSTHIVFIWVLRSFFFTFYKRLKIGRDYPESVLRSLYNLRVAKKLKNLCFFVSEPMIKLELEALGISTHRVLIRPERTCRELTPLCKRAESELNLLTIGTLRPEKRIELCIEAVNKLSDPFIKYLVAGKAYSLHGYDQKIARLSKESKYVTRIEERFDDFQYKKLISDCDFLILCDEKQPSCITNGTMAEALLAGKPIIAPNNNPYKYYIKKYSVGILYDLNNVESLVAAIKKARNCNYSHFDSGIARYQADFMYDKVVSIFSDSLHSILKQF